MSLQFHYDLQGLPEFPTLLLGNRGGQIYGVLENVQDLRVSASLKDPWELSFTLYREPKGGPVSLWKQIRDFRLVYVKDWDLWFEMKVDLEESTQTRKKISAQSLCQAELSQTNVYNLEINTEADILREDYQQPTVLYRQEDPSSSLLHRVLEKAPQFQILHVDSSLAPLQRTFSWDSRSIYSVFQDIAQELHCLFVFDNGSAPDGSLRRGISVYDLESLCLDCGHRGEFTDLCPSCGGHRLHPGYGEDTTVFVSVENLTDEISYETETGSVKNCFRLEAGDDLMTATVANCNPNGSSYLWYFSPEMKADMSSALQEKLSGYDRDYAYYQKEYEPPLPRELLAEYNRLVNRYQSSHEELSPIETPITGFPSLMNTLYDVIDFEGFLTNELMPKTDLPQDTSAADQAALLTSASLSPVAVQDLGTLSAATGDSSVLSMAKVLVDTSRYRVQVEEGSAMASPTLWEGSLTVSSYSDSADTASTGLLRVQFSDDYETFVRQKLEKLLGKRKDTSLGIVSLFQLEPSVFAQELKNYCLASLSAFENACAACLDILIEQGVSGQASPMDEDQELYQKLYLNYLNRRELIRQEAQLRRQEIGAVAGIWDSQGTLVRPGMRSCIQELRDQILEKLDIQQYLGREAWLELCSHRREDVYRNDNYISDGLSNSELFSRALGFLETAGQEIYKSAALQHRIRASLQNLLAIRDFAPLREHFQLGNWLRILVDGQVYRLRLISYEMDFSDPARLPVEFSDVLKTAGGLSDIESILDSSSSMSSSYSSVKRQAEKGDQSNTLLSGWVDQGLDLTLMKIVNDASNQNLVCDASGLLAREYNDVLNQYDDRQLKLINKGIYLTEDGWKTARTGLGLFHYYDPREGVWKEGYGVIADTIVGNIILGREVGIYNESNSISLSQEGLILTADSGDSRVQQLFAIQKRLPDGALVKQMSIDQEGNIVFGGNTKITWTQENRPAISDVTGLEDYLREVETQVDGKIQTHWGSQDPSASWDAQEKLLHLGDIWYDTLNKEAKIFQESGSWARLEDAEAQAAKALAGRKGTIFTVQPSPPYQLGDLWAQGEEGELLCCIHARSAGDFQASDWEPAAKYTDDSALNSFVADTYAQDVLRFQKSLDDKIQTYAQDEDPSLSWDTEELRRAHTGDLWYSGSIIYRWNGSDWEMFMDISGQINEIYSKVYAEIEKTSTGLLTRVGETTYTKAQVDKLLSDVNTEYEQTKDSFTFKFNQLLSELNASGTSTENKFNEINKYIRFDNGEIIIGIQGNPLILRMKNDRISFYENNSEVAYISNRKLYITDSEVINSLKLGQYAWIPRDNGNLSLRKTG